MITLYIMSSSTERKLVVDDFRQRQGERSSFNFVKLKKKMKKKKNDYTKKSRLCYLPTRQCIVKNIRQRHISLVINKIYLYTCIYHKRLERERKRETRNLFFFLAISGSQIFFPLQSRLQKKFFFFKKPHGKLYEVQKRVSLRLEA